MVLLHSFENTSAALVSIVLHCQPIWDQRETIIKKMISSGNRPAIRLPITSLFLYPSDKLIGFL